jgi:hypothetical protein
MDPKTNTPMFLTAPGTFNYHAFEATFMACDASVPNLQNHLTYDHVLNMGIQCHHSESFLAGEDINLSNKHKTDQEDVDSDDETVQISNISHIDVAHDDKCPIHPTSNHKWGDAAANQPVNLSNGVPLHVLHCHNKLMLTRIMRLYLHLMTKLNYFDGTTTWDIFPSPC